MLSKPRFFQFFPKNCKKVTTYFDMDFLTVRTYCITFFKKMLQNLTL